MQDYAKQLLSAINQYDADNPESVNHLRDLVCWISDNDALKKDNGWYAHRCTGSAYDTGNTARQKCFYPPFWAGDQPGNLCHLQSGYVTQG